MTNRIFDYQSNYIIDLYFQISFINILFYLQKKFMLPWWFVIIAYLMCFGSVGWCFYAVVSVAFGFGPTKAAEWLGSFTMSFVESVCFTQPIKVSREMSSLALELQYR